MTRFFSAYCIIQMQQRADAVFAEVLKHKFVRIDLESPFSPVFRETLLANILPTNSATSQSDSWYV